MSDDKPQPPQDDSVASDELTQLKEELAKLKDLAARSQADLQNAKDRLEREAAEMRKFAVEGAFVTLLPTIDNLNRALDHLPEDLADHDWTRGIDATVKELDRQLETMGLTKIAALGEVADPAKHEVLQTGEGEEGKVIEVYEEGWELHGKVLRPAKVKVGEG